MKPSHKQVLRSMMICSDHHKHVIYVDGWVAAGFLCSHYEYSIDWSHAAVKFCSFCFVLQFAIFSPLQVTILLGHSSLVTCSMVPPKVMDQVQGANRTLRLTTWAQGSTRGGRCPTMWLSFRIRWVQYASNWINTTLRNFPVKRLTLALSPWLLYCDRAAGK